MSGVGEVDSDVLFAHKMLPDRITFLFIWQGFIALGGPEKDGDFDISQALLKGDKAARSVGDRDADPLVEETGGKDFDTVRGDHLTKAILNSAVLTGLEQVMSLEGGSGQGQHRIASKTMAGDGDLVGEFSGQRILVGQLQDIIQGSRDILRAIITAFKINGAFGIPEGIKKVVRGDHDPPVAGEEFREEIALGTQA